MSSPYIEQLIDFLDSDKFYSWHLDGYYFNNGCTVSYMLITVDSVKDMAKNTVKRLLEHLKASLDSIGELSRRLMEIEFKGKELMFIIKFSHSSDDPLCLPRNGVYHDTISTCLKGVNVSYTVCGDSRLNRVFTHSDYIDKDKDQWTKFSNQVAIAHKYNPRVALMRERESRREKDPQK